MIMFDKKNLDQPFSTAYLRSGHGGSILIKEAQTSLSPASSSSFNKFWDIPRPGEKCSPFTVSWVIYGAFS